MKRADIYMATDAIDEAITLGSASVVDADVLAHVLRPTANVVGAGAIGGALQAETPYGQYLEAAPSPPGSATSIVVASVAAALLRR